MRFFEILVSAMSAATVVLVAFSRNGRLAAFASLLCAGSVAAQLLLEGFRLQAVPLYLSVCAISFLPWVVPGVSVAGRLAFAAAALALAVAGTIACLRYPVIRFANPPGPYAIGTRTFYLQDPQRLEKYALSPQGLRRFAVQVWYPASPCTGAPAPYRDRSTLRWKSAHLRWVKTHACSDAPFTTTSRPWPVVFFSPSSGGYRSQNTYLAESLASQGYVFFGFDHPDTSSRIAFPDGSLAYSLPDTWLSLESRSALARSLPKTEALMQTNAADMRFFLDKLQSAVPSDPWYSITQHLDLSKIAAVGHSFGGAAAAEVCRTDGRFRTGVNMDGWMFGEVNRTGAGKPFLFLVAGGSLAQPDPGPFPDNEAGLGREGDKQFVEAAERSVDHWGGAVVRVRGTSHTSFADMALMIRPSFWQEPDVLNPAAAHLLISNLITGFLTDQLHEKVGAFPAALARYREQLEVFPTPAHAGPAAAAASTLSQTIYGALQSHEQRSR